MTAQELQTITDMVARQLEDFAKQQKQDPAAIQRQADAIIGGVQDDIKRCLNANLPPLIARIEALEQRQ